MNLIVVLSLFMIPFLIISLIFYIYNYYHHKKENKKYNEEITKISKLYHQEMNRNNKDEPSLPAICDV